MRDAKVWNYACRKLKEEAQLRKNGHLLWVISTHVGLLRIRALDDYH